MRFTKSVSSGSCLGRLIFSRTKIPSTQSVSANVLTLLGGCVFFFYLFSEVLIRRAEEQQEKKENDKSKVRE